MSDTGRVLIADDDDAIRHLVSKVLELDGVPHDAVRDGRAAIECLEKHEYALLLVDLMMPGVSGYDVLEYLKQHPRKPGTVLVMTAASDTDLRRLDGNVVTTVVRKPFDIQQLAILVRDAAIRSAEATRNKQGDNVLPFPSSGSGDS
ncbi:MAG: response regulator [Acidobacteriota bacterium]